MAQKSIGPTSEDGCQTLTVKGQVRMADGIDPWVESMQAPSIHSAIHGAA